MKTTRSLSLVVLSIIAVLLTAPLSIKAQDNHAQAQFRKGMADEDGGDVTITLETDTGRKLSKTLYARPNETTEDLAERFTTEFDSHHGTIALDAVAGQFQLGHDTVFTITITPRGEDQKNFRITRVTISTADSGISSYGVKVGERATPTAATISIERAPTPRDPGGFRFDLCIGQFQTSGDDADILNDLGILLESGESAETVLDRLSQELALLGIHSSRQPQTLTAMFPTDLFFQVGGRSVDPESLNTGYRISYSAQLIDAPEPGTVILMAAGLFALLWVRIRPARLGRTTDQFRRGSAALLLLFVALASPAQVSAAMYDATKSVTWDVTTPTRADGLGIGVIGVHAFGEDGHSGGPKHDDTDNTNLESATELGLTVRLRPSGKVPNAMPSTTHTQNGPKHRLPLRKSTFNQEMPHNDSDTADTETEHTLSHAFASYETTRDEYHEGAIDQLVYGKIRVAGKASLQNLPLHKPPGETAYAEAYSEAQLQLAGNARDPQGERGGKAIEKVTLRKDRVSVSGITEGVKNLTRYRDPISITVLSLDTGEEMAHEVLFADTWEAADGAAIDFTPETGLKMTVGPRGFAYIEYATLSDWVVNPVSGSVRLDAGGMTALGDLASLPWQVVTLTDQITATLSPQDLLAGNHFFGAVPLDFIVPRFSDVTGDLQLVLTADGNGFAGEYATTAVPEPATAMCLSLGACLLAVARTRQRTAG